MENGSVIKSLEIRKDDNCKVCHDAIRELVPLAERNNIPVTIKNALSTDTFLPMVCFIEDDKRTCFEGYNDDIKDMFKLFIFK